MEISEIQLIVNHNVNFNFEDTKIKNLLIIGNTINFFGFFNDGRINMMSMNKNDRYHYMWLLKRCKEKINIYIIGESEECKYYTNLFNYFGSLGIKVNWKFMETKEPKDYLEKLSSLKNMKFDYIVGNPPFGSVGGDTLHLKCLDMVYDKFTKKMLIIMPWGFVTKDTKSFKKYQIKFAPKLQYVKEVLSSNFEGTHMPSAAIYEFTNEETEMTILEDLSGNKTEKSDLTNVSLFTPYEEEIIKYLENQGQQKIIGDCGRLNSWKKQVQGLNNDDYKNKLFEIIETTSAFKKLKKEYNENSNIYGLLVNRVNGGCNGKYLTPNNGQILSSYNNFVNYFYNNPLGIGYNCLLFNSFISAENCKKALQNPLLRFICFKLQIDHNMVAGRVYKYVPAIDWEDERCLTDEGLLEICGCPKDKTMEYVEYVKNYVEERDKEFENRKKRK